MSKGIVNRRQMPKNKGRGSWQAEMLTNAVEAALSGNEQEQP
jgi:hypothetical protein